MNKNIVVENPVQKSFLSFVNQLYSDRKTGDAFSCLKEKYNLNVNLLMFCCWAASHNYHCLNYQDIKIIIKKIDFWHKKVIDGLIELKRLFPKNYVNDKIQELYGLVVDNEKFAEEIERYLIFQSAENIEKKSLIKTSPANRALSNIFNYVKSQQIIIHKNDLEKIYRIVKSCFEDSENF